jgi:hypothetical protein
LLYGVYQEIFEQQKTGGSLPYSEVSFEHLAKYFFRLAFGNGEQS